MAYPLQGLCPSRWVILAALLSSLLCPELPENWTDTRETLLEGMLFSLKYLGMTLVEQPKGEELSAAAVKRIVATVSPVRVGCGSSRRGASSCGGG